jgi:hypothetical protein
MSAFGEEGTLFANIGKDEIFTPIKVYPPMTVKDLASHGVNDDGKEGV